MPNKYVARYNGQIVGKRTSKDRTYSHAYVMQRDEAAERAYAYGYQPSEADRKNFRYYVEISEQGINHEHIRATSWRPEPDLAELSRARSRIEGGWEGYVARERQRQIDFFEVGLAGGKFEPFVGGWASRKDLAEKAARGFETRGCKTLAIVPAEPVEPKRK